MRFARLRKDELLALADALLYETPGAVDGCVAFILAESRGHWHGRARAKMCRRLKHCAVTPEQSRLLVECITARLASGRFSEQFRDQLRLAQQLDPERVNEVARQCIAASHTEHVRRYAAWLLAHTHVGGGTHSRRARESAITL